MAERLTDSQVKSIEAPARGNRITYDTDVKGFGVRVTSAGARAFVLNYRTARRERRITIGSFPDWSVKSARDAAKTLKRRIDQGEDPMQDRAEKRDAKSIAELCDRFEEDYLPARRTSTAEDYKSLIRLYIRPNFGKLKVAALCHADVAALHREIAKRAPYRANRLLAVLSVMMAEAIKEGMRDDNPTKGIERAHEERRERFLSPDEIARLAEGLAAHPEKISASAILLMLLTGARRGEVLAATWDQFDGGAGAWVKPSSHTKQKKAHRVPLSAPALALIADMRRESKAGCPYVFPSAKTSFAANESSPATCQPLTEVRRTWASVCKTAGLDGVRLHDLRHSFASVLASAGLSLPIVGALLGHSQPRTTARYAHLYDDVLRAATERVGAVVTRIGKPGAEVSPLRLKGAGG
jgi:integrase